jgi:hypothetical protein
VSPAQSLPGAVDIVFTAAVVRERRPVVATVPGAGFVRYGHGSRRGADRLPRRYRYCLRQPRAAVHSHYRAQHVFYMQLTVWASVDVCCAWGVYVA